jgi:hypothetical protein
VLETNCCICKEEVKSPYSYHQHLENNKLRIYTGHKRCLSLVPNRLKNGVALSYEEIDISKFKTEA